MTFSRHVLRTLIERALEGAYGFLTLVGTGLLIFFVLVKRSDGLAWIAVAFIVLAVIGVRWLRWRVQVWFAPSTTAVFGRARFGDERSAAEAAGLVHQRRED